MATNGNLHFVAASDAKALVVTERRQCLTPVAIRFHIALHRQGVNTDLFQMHHITVRHRTITGVRQGKSVLFGIERNRDVLVTVAVAIDAGLSGRGA